MEKIKRVVSNLIAILYFMFPMGLVILFLVFTPITFFSDISAIRTSGFAGPDDAVSLIGFCGLIIGLSLLIPPIRKIYSFLPWFYPFVKVFFISMMILMISISILNHGYKTVNPTRHTIFFILSIAFVIVGRLAMSFYFKWRPVNKENEGLIDEQR